MTNVKSSASNKLSVMRATVFAADAFDTLLDAATTGLTIGVTPVGRMLGWFDG
jgi:hypothetical protein